jgi:hypothetical protein
MGNPFVDGHEQGTAVRSLAVLLVWLAGAAPSRPVLASDRPDARFSVVARVVHRARLETRSTAAPIRITPEDLRRGHLIVRRTYTVETTSKDAPVLRVMPLPPLLDSLRVRGFGAELRTLDTELDIVPPMGRPFTVEYELHLAEGILPGTYSLPVHVDLIPLHRAAPSGQDADDQPASTHLVGDPRN